MHSTRSLPFVISKLTSDLSRLTSNPGQSVVYTRDSIQGLLRLESNQLFIQWRFTRKIEHYGIEVRTDSEEYPMREHVIPISKLSEVRVRRRRFMIPPRRTLVLVSSDLQVFDPLTGDGEVPGLALQHPAELVIQVRRADHQLLEEFASQLRMAISEQVLDSLEQDLKQINGPKKRLGP
ncbi:MAG: hypothetical protein KTR29_18005 [Rhodothermaceae bacterium]|nr:hypothetical protein [Rhodothermaceae bacterium]